MERVMVAVILGILKGIGILLLAVLLTVLAVLILILAVPVRYRGRIIKNESEFAGTFCAFWLLHLFGVKALFDQVSGSYELQILLFGKPLSFWKKLFRSLFRKKGSRVHTDRSSEPDALEEQRQAQPLPYEEAESENQAEPEIEKEPESRAEPRPEANSENQAEPESRAEPRPEADLENQAGPESRAEPQPEADSENQAGPESRAEPRPEAESEGQEEPADGPQGESAVRRLINRILSLPENAGKFLQRIKNAVLQLEETVRRLARAVKSIPEKAEELRDFVETYEVWEVIRDLKKEVLDLLGHYLPRRLAGYLRFGTGDPASTGELTGVLYLLLPAKAEFSIEPDFTCRMLETELECSGHIRAIHAGLAAYRLFRNQRLKRLIRRLRKKGD